LKKNWVKDGSIAQLQTRDDYGFMPNWKRYAYYLAPFLAVTTLALYWLYFGLRIRFTISAQEKEHATFPMAWVFIAVEISVAVPVFLQSFWSIFILKKRNRPKLRLVGNDVPTVDVFVTCCGEDDDLILDTVRAACDVDYPSDRFRVVVLDDGKAESLERAVIGLQDIYPNLHYRSREKLPGVPHHFKAGNLNYGLDEVHNMPGGASQFMAALDADMIPEQVWLRAIMPHLLIDDKMALACPPQVCCKPTRVSGFLTDRDNSSFTTFPPAIRYVKVLISLCMYRNRSKMRLVWPGVLDLVTSPGETLWMR
jgi:cellulose synthase/poly-beta-1,6-N-acetylglucosamine synthase-like glycosyltransferase